MRMGQGTAFLGTVIFMLGNVWLPGFSVNRLVTLQPRAFQFPKFEVFSEAAVLTFCRPQGPKVQPAPDFACTLLALVSKEESLRIWLNSKSHFLMFSIFLPDASIESRLQYHCGQSLGRGPAQKLPHYKMELWFQQRHSQHTASKRYLGKHRHVFLYFNSVLPFRLFI